MNLRCGIAVVNQAYDFTSRQTKTSRRILVVFHLYSSIYHLVLRFAVYECVALQFWRRTANLARAPSHANDALRSRFTRTPLEQCSGLLHSNNHTLFFLLRNRYSRFLNHVGFLSNSSFCNWKRQRPRWSKRAHLRRIRFSFF